MDLKCSACKTLVFDERKQRTKGYRCIQCEDFVLCSDCERLTYERHFATHVFIVFKKEHAHKTVNDFPLADKEKVTVNMGSKHPHNCTVCGLPTIVGVMYSCTHCADFHVCSEDYETNPKVANHNPDHSFMKIPTIFAPLNEIIWDLDANSTWFKGKEEKDFLFDTNAMLKQLNDKKKAPAKTSKTEDSKTPKPMIDKQSNARYLDGLTPTPTTTVSSQYTDEGAKNTGAVTSHYTEGFTPVSSPQVPHSQYTNELGTTSQYVDESARTGASEMLKGNIVSSGYTDGSVVANKPVTTSGYTDGLSENKVVATSGYTDGLVEDKATALSGYTDGSSPASPNADRLSRYIHTGNDSVPPLVYSSGDLSVSNGSLYSGTLEYPTAPSRESLKPKEEPKEEKKPEEKPEVKAEVSSPKERKHKEHKHKKEDSKGGMKKSKSERTDEKHKDKKEKKSKRRNRSNSHGHKDDHVLALSAPVTPVKEEPVSVEKAPETCPKKKESKVTRKDRSSSMPEKKFKLALRKSHKSKTNIDDHKTAQSVEITAHPVLVEPTVVSQSAEISPKSPRKDKSSKKSPKSDRPVSMPVQPKKGEDLKAIADFYIETGLQAEGAKDKKHKEKREKKEKKSKRPKSSRSNTATSTEISHAYTAPELGRYTSAEELFEINRRLVEGEPSTPKGAPAPSNVNAASLSSSGSNANHNYVSHIDSTSNAQESKDQKTNVPGTSYAANYLTSPPSAAVNYMVNPNIDPGVDVESDSEEHGPETELGYQTAMNRKMYAATSYANYGSTDDLFDLNENAYSAQPIEDIETAFESKPIAKVQGPISLSKMALRPQATDLAQSSGTGTNWGDDYMKTLREMVGTKDRMMKIMKGERVEVTPEMRTQVLNFRQHVQDFRAAASNIAKRIIDEAFLPLHQKTIKPVDVGGIAGGQKYVYDGIFLKFAIDLFGVYGGDYAAAKAANRELQGLKGYYEAMIPGLMVPPMLLIDYRGFRMVATPCLPINKDTLEYGSADGGLTVLKKSKELNKKMKLAAKKMKLKGHIVGTNSPTQIYGPADIEGHTSSIDGAHFVIDTARVSPPFPPEKTISAIFLPQDPVTTNPWVRYGEGTKLLDVPIKNLKNNLRQYFPHLPAHAQLEESNMPGATIYHVPEQYLKERVLNRIATSAVHKLIYGDVVLIYTLRLRGTQLYDLLRLELLQHPEVPALSSDAFTFFQQAGIEKDNDEADVRKAVQILKDKIIPQFCDDLLNKRINVWSSPSALVDEMHKRGINIKFLGDIRTRVISDAKLDSLVTIEMVARASKYFLRSQLRRIKSREIKQDEIKVILGNFNMVIGDSIASRYYWQFIIRALVTAKFGPSFCDVEKNDLDFDLRSAINDKYALFTALEAHTGIKFKPEIHAKLRADPALFDQKIVVRASDFDSLEARHRTWGDECIQKKLDRITAALNEIIEKSKESKMVIEEEGQKLHVEVPVV